MNTDYSYCNGKELEFCKQCKRNINNYKPNGDYIWMHEPTIKDGGCESYEKIEVK